MLMEIKYILLMPFGYFLSVVISMIKDYCEVKYNHDQQIKKN